MIINEGKYLITAETLSCKQRFLGHPRNLCLQGTETQASELETPTVAERLSMKFIMRFSFHFVRWVIHEFESKSLFCLSFAR